jgi:KaiC/GvpD/RAD55 family RecA-like ATPase
MKIPTGLRGLDSLVEGGFDKGSLIVVSGGPGTGKTILSSIILFSSAEFLKERVLYVSFGETKQNIIKTVMELAARRIPQAELDRRSQEILSSGRVEIMDMSTFANKEAEQLVLDTVLENVVKKRPSKLVIDPFSVLFRDGDHSFSSSSSQQQQPPSGGELRSILHNFFGKILHELECTTILVVESTSQSRAITEEFASDGIITLDRVADEGRTLRTISISKMRRTAIEKNMALFSLHSGFRIFKPFSALLPRRIKHFSHTQNPVSFFSSGSQALDRLLGRGFRKGTSVLIESSENVSDDALANLLDTIILNTLYNDNIVLGLPFAAMSSRTIRSMIEPFCSNRLIENNFRIFDYGVAGEEKKQEKDPVSIKMSGELNKDRDVWLKTLQDLSKRGNPVLKFYGLDNLECRYDPKKVLSMLALDVSMTAASSGLTIFLAKPNLELSKTYANMASMHLKIDSRFGTIILHGIKPWTPNYELELNFSQGYPEVELQAIM